MTRIDLPKDSFALCTCVGGQEGASLWRAMRSHLPFTAVGGLLGMGALTLWWFAGKPAIMEGVFWWSHVLHVMLSAAATAAVFKAVGGRGGMWGALLIGMIAAVVLGCMSDVILPHAGERMLGWNPQHIHPGGASGFFALWSAGLVGSIVGWRVVASRTLHSLHVLVSVAASMGHLGMAAGDANLTAFIWGIILLILIIAVWLPCCFSDIVLPWCAARLTRGEAS